MYSNCVDSISQNKVSFITLQQYFYRNNIYEKKVYDKKKLNAFIAHIFGARVLKLIKTQQNTHKWTG